MESDEAGLCLVERRRALARSTCSTISNTTPRTLAEEYWRDTDAGKPIDLPKNYFPGGDPHAPPENRWRSHAHLLFGNWINEVYQTTPFDLNDIGR